MATKVINGRKVYGPYKGSQEGTPPGKLLAEELEVRGMTQLALAQAMGRPYKTVNEIVRGKKIITADTALDLEGALGIPATLWLTLDQRYRLAQAKLRRAAKVS